MGERIRGFRPGSRVLRPQLEVVVLLGMVESKPDQARHDLVPQASRRLEAGLLDLPLEGLRGGAQAERLDDLRVQLGDRHLGVGVDDDLGLAREGRKRFAELPRG